MTSAAGPPPSGAVTVSGHRQHQQGGPPGSWREKPHAPGHLCLQMPALPTNKGPSPPAASAVRRSQVEQEPKLRGTDRHKSPTRTRRRSRAHAGPTCAHSPHACSQALMLAGWELRAPGPPEATRLGGKCGGSPGPVRRLTPTRRRAMCPGSCRGAAAEAGRIAEAAARQGLQTGKRSGASRAPASPGTPLAVRLSLNAQAGPAEAPEGGAVSKGPAEETAAGFAQTFLQRRLLSAGRPGARGLRASVSPDPGDGGSGCLPRPRPPVSRG